ncbi:hypothetical protein DM860_010196 [Cuscuta australis]|uniref:non-specific serine/threonine protein kinase n=1 Tax=Cuscuta australis TaxID=267555 RepID=A0A328D6B3_9ASTE|nr:hypothetical protein DM860_010196 [Cuscuta australis]
MIQSSSQTVPGEENNRTVIFGKYEMGKVLGHGTFAKVYFARNLKTSEPVAVKVVRKDQVAKQGMAEQIQREIAVMRLARHPNVVELREVMATKRKIFFVMEYVRGGELLARVAAEGRLEEEEARRISIPAIKKSPWFLVGETTAPISASIPGNSGDGGIMGTPPFFNAFELISSMASGFDLSSLFGGGRSPGSLFTSRLSAPAVVERLVAAFEDLDFRVVCSKEYRVRMQRSSGGRAAVGLTVTAEVFEVAPDLTVVEFSLTAGDASEYKKFCEEDARRALNGVIWTWQGEEMNSNCQR